MRLICFFIVCIVNFGGTCTLKMGDILDAEYLPSTLLIEEASIEENTSEVYPNSTTEGEISDAFATMQYHRSKMNEYLCRSYVADEILSKFEPHATARLGIPAKKNHKNHRPRDYLLKDQGSSSYRDWLTRSTLLDDVYRHYDSMMDQDDSDSLAAGSEVESGDVTGYVVQSGSGGIGKSPPNFGSGVYSGGLDTVHLNGYPNHYSPSPTNDHETDYQEHHGGGEEHHYVIHEEDHGKGGLAVKDLFELALTALAFLAFGVFIVNLVLTVLLGNNMGTTIVMSTVTTTATGAAKLHRGRERRSYLDDNSLNEMAYRVLTSFERLKKLHDSRPNETDVRRECFKYSLCQNNKYSRSLNGAKRLWLPIWSFGLSWLIGRLGEDRLSSLQASVLGLGNADCKSVYPACERVA